MRIIPALDVANGLAVKAKGGQRAAYQPLPDYPEPIRAAQWLMAQANSDTIYVADLDAITGQPVQHEVIEQITQLPHLKELWLDSGIRTENDLPTQIGPKLRLVLGTETLADSVLLLQAAAEFGSQNVVVSWDFQDGQWLGRVPPEQFYEDVFFAGITKHIVLDIGRVGIGDGPGHLVNTTRQLKQRFPAAEIYTGGGIRDSTDIDSLKAAGANGVLVASMLMEKGRGVS